MVPSHGRYCWRHRASEGCTRPFRSPNAAGSAIESGACGGPKVCTPAAGPQPGGARMGPVESKTLTYIKHRLDEGELSVSKAEIMDAVIPPDHPELRERPAADTVLTETGSGTS